LTNYTHNLCIRKNIEEKKLKKENEKKEKQASGAHGRRDRSEPPRDRAPN
jgi:hypothetical protein